MARCGRCGLWESYPQNDPDRMWAGACLWYQTRLPDGFVYESRECADFFERFPSMSPKEHFDYKIARENIRDGYTAARRALVFSLLAVFFSIFSIWGTA